MGGYGCGRRSSRDTTEDYRRIDVRFMERNGYLRMGAAGSLEWSRRGERIAHIDYRSEPGQVVLSYSARERGGEWEKLTYPVRLDRTPCNYGGSRAWFVCPARGCGKRVATLFGGRIFACRQCYGLAYASQRESRSDRASERAMAILKRLRCDNFYTIFDSDPPRPKGMHYRTYLRLATRYERARYESFRFGPIGAMAMFEPGSPVS